MRSLLDWRGNGKGFQTNDEESGVVAVLLVENASLMSGGVKGQDGSDRLVEKLEKQHRLQPRCAEQHRGTMNMGLSFSVSLRVLTSVSVT